MERLNRLGVILVVIKPKPSGHEAGEDTDNDYGVVDSEHRDALDYLCHDIVI